MKHLIKFVNLKDCSLNKYIYSNIEAQKKHHKMTVYRMTKDDLVKLWCYTRKKFVNITDEDNQKFDEYMKKKGLIFD